MAPRTKTGTRTTVERGDFLEKRSRETRWSWPSLTRRGRERDYGGSGALRANFTVHDTTTRSRSRSRPRHTTRHDTTRQSRRPGAYRARRPRRPAHPDIILGPSRAAFPVLRHLSSFTLVLLLLLLLLYLLRLSSSAATTSSGRFSPFALTERTIARHNFSPRSTSSGARQLALSFNGLSWTALRRRLTATAGSFCLPRWRPRSVPTVPSAARATPHRPSRPITSVRRRRSAAAVTSFLLGATEIRRSNRNERDAGRSN